MSAVTRTLILRGTVLALALSLPSFQAADAGQAARTRPGHATRPSGSATHAAGHATYGHYSGHYSGHHSYYGHYGHYGYGWYPWLGYAYWPSWGVSYAPSHSLVRDSGESRPQPALIEIDVSPSKAELRIDGEAAGVARDFNGRFDLLALKPGRHVLEFSRPKYQTLRVVIEAEANGYLRIADRLAHGAGLDPRSDELPPPLPDQAASRPGEVSPEPPQTGGPPAQLADGLLRIRAEPSDATVYLDGEFLARADELARLHGALPVARGVHLLEVVRPGFETESRRIEVQGEQPVTAEIRLRRSGPAEIK